MTRDQLNIWKANIAFFAESVRVECDGESITQRECAIEIALRRAFNAGLEAACITTDSIRPYDDIRRVSKLIRTDRMDEAVLGYEERHSKNCSVFTTVGPAWCDCLNKPCYKCGKIARRRKEPCSYHS